MPTARLALIALDCVEPRSLAAFYQSLIGGRIKESTASDDWVRLETGAGVDLGFQRDPDYAAPRWPNGPSQQAHLDLDVDDLDEGERAAVKLGAEKAGTQPSPDEWRVLIDPSGHPFCLIKA